MEKSIFKNEIKFLSLKRALPVFVGMLLVSTIFVSCVTPPVREECSRELLGTGIKNQEQLVKFFMNHKPDADRERVERLAGFYIEEAAIEGINSDVAFVQMCHETGFLGFGNLVLPEMNNFCGLGDTAGRTKQNSLIPCMTLPKTGLQTRIMALNWIHF